MQYFTLVWSLVIPTLLVASAPGVASAQPVIDSSTGRAYELVRVSVNWSTARSSAESRSFRGAQGRLATVTSAAENSFINSLGDVDLLWIGGFQPAGTAEPLGGWQWVTGETWSYTRWFTPGEPNDTGGNEDALIYAHGSAGNRFWNDANAASLARGYIVEYAVPPDSDGDGVLDYLDCAPSDPSRWRNLAYPDGDSDGVRNSLALTTCPCFGALIPSGFTLNANGPDNCGSVPNPDQRNTDGDGQGDACDPDDDNDDVEDGFDCSPRSAAAWRNQAFPDSDNDGVRDSAIMVTCPCFGIVVPAGYTLNPNGLDNCPWFNPAQTDTDSDGVGDGCDNCYATSNPNQADSDIDGFGDSCDCAPLSDLTWRNQAYPDADGDGAADSMTLVPCSCYGYYVPQGFADPDNSNLDNCIGRTNPDQSDVDGDGVGDVCDNCVTFPNADQVDSDGDDVGNACDNCPTTYNPDQSDINRNGIGWACDPEEGAALAPLLVDMSGRGAGEVTSDCGAYMDGDGVLEGDSSSRSRWSGSVQSGGGLLGTTYSGSASVSISAEGRSWEVRAGNSNGSYLAQADGGGECNVEDRLTAAISIFVEVTRPLAYAVTGSAHASPFPQSPLQPGTYWVEISDVTAWTTITFSDPCGDRDNDGACDSSDNCPDAANADQIDSDGDGIGDACDRCVGDFNQDGGIDGLDVTDFFHAWESGVSESDVNQDGGVDGDDVVTFFDRWEAGGC